MMANKGANWEIAIDGKPRSHRDDKTIAFEAALYLKYRHLRNEVTARDLATGEVTPVKV
jgi:hypothetical protein